MIDLRCFIADLDRQSLPGGNTRRIRIPQSAPYRRVAYFFPCSSLWRYGLEQGGKSRFPNLTTQRIRPVAAGSHRRKRLLGEARPVYRVPFVYLSFPWQRKRLAKTIRPWSLWGRVGKLETQDMSMFFGILGVFNLFNAPQERKDRRSRLSKIKKIFFSERTVLDLPVRFFCFFPCELSLVNCCRPRLK